MLYLSLAIFCSLLLVIIFKNFDRYKINHNQAITINYIICVVVGYVVLGEMPLESSMIYEAWVFPILVLGALLVGGFNIVSRTIQHFGVAVSTVAQRMSMAISISFSIWFYKEDYNIYQIIGILTALSAVVFINIPSKKIIKTEKKSFNWLLILPLVLCCSSATIEILLQYINKVHKLTPDVQAIAMFGSAGLIGAVFLLIQLVLGKEKIAVRNISAGIILGIPNYFSLYFILKAFETIDKGSTVYAINNISIVAGAALIGVLGFNEKLNLINVLGIVFAVLSIFLITL